jgi:hypothetical protein
MQKCAFNSKNAHLIRKMPKNSINGGKCRRMQENAEEFD